MSATQKRMPMEKTKPIRIQRKRTKGWRMPENTIYVGRPTIWGNPFTTCCYRSREEAVQRFKQMMNGEFDNCGAYIKQKNDILHNLHLLKGKNLCCWCPLDKPCHADVLLEIANR